MEASQYADVMKTVMDENPAKYATVDFHTSEELAESGAKTILGEGEGRSGPGYYGSAVKPDGDITGVFSSAKNGGSNAIIAALENGGNKLDAYSINVAHALSWIFHWEFHTTSYIFPSRFRRPSGGSLLELKKYIDEQRNERDRLASARFSLRV